LEINKIFLKYLNLFKMATCILCMKEPSNAGCFYSSDHEVVENYKIRDAIRENFDFFNVRFDNTHDHEPEFKIVLNFSSKFSSTIHRISSAPHASPSSSPSKISKLKSAKITQTFNAKIIRTFMTIKITTKMTSEMSTKATITQN
jgi:hypothetical protein